MNAKYLPLLILLLTLSVILLLPGPVRAQSGGGYDLWWQVFGNGGVTFASGGGYQLGYTVGQCTPPGVSSGGGYQLAQGFWAGVSGPVPAKPRAITDLSISKASGKAKLDWSAISEDVNGHLLSGVTYNVYRAINTPWFTPGTPYASGVTGTTYTDPDATVLSDASKNAYYLVRAVSAGLEADDSNRVGTFNFTLVPGSP